MSRTHMHACMHEHAEGGRRERKDFRFGDGMNDIRASMACIQVQNKSEGMKKKKKGPKKDATVAVSSTGGIVDVNSKPNLRN